MADQKDFSPDPEGTVSRRMMMRYAVGLIGGSAALAALGACSGPQEVEAGTRLLGPGRHFTDIRMTRLSVIADIMIPETDTPGALAAEVPAFIDAMMVNWAAPETRARFDRVIDAIDAAAVAVHGDRLTRLERAHQEEIVSEYDRRALAAGDWPYRQFKELILLGYYHSEIGATQELQYKLIPGAFAACAPLADIGPAWAD